MDKVFKKKKIIKFIDWIFDNKDQFFIFIIIFILCIAIIPLVMNANKQKLLKKIDAYAFVESNYFSNDFDKTIELADKFLLDYKGKNNFTKLILFIKANSFYKLENYKESKEIFKKLISDYKKDELFVNFLDGLAYSCEELGEYNEALENFNKIITDFPESYLLENSYKSVARIYEILGDKEKAKETYSTIYGIFKDKELGNFAKWKLLKFGEKISE